MLTRLSIRNIVLIEALDLTFGRGLGVLTGETGAGKSILLDALGLVLGNRADGLVRGGEDKASVGASFEFATLPRALAERLDDADIEIEDGEPLIVRRQLRADGKGKAFVNDQPVGVGLLREIAGFLVELLKPATIAVWSTRAAIARCSIALPGSTARSWPRHGPAGAAPRTPGRGTYRGRDCQGRPGPAARASRRADRARTAGGRGSAARRNTRRRTKGEELSGRSGRIAAPVGRLRIRRSHRCASPRAGSTGLPPNTRCWPKRWRRSTAR